MCSGSFDVFGLLLERSSLRTGSSFGFLILFSVLGVVVDRLRLGILLLLIVRKFLLVPLTLIFSWFRRAYFQYHAHVRLRFKLASGLGEPWTRDGGIPQGCPLSMMFIVAWYLPWYRYLAAHG